MTYDPRTIERAGFVAPTCECGHAVGDHRTVAAGLNVRHGVCLLPDCGCRKYREQA